MRPSRKVETAIGREPRFLEPRPSVPQGGCPLLADSKAEKSCIFRAFHEHFSCRRAGAALISRWLSPPFTRSPPLWHQSAVACCQTVACSDGSRPASARSRGMHDQPGTGLQQLRLQAYQRPAADPARQRRSPHQISQVQPGRQPERVRELMPPAASQTYCRE
jgi:hypothetical protein